MHSDLLTQLASKYKTDKFGSHNYTVHYENHFEKFRYRKIDLLEIGIGGYNDPKKGGESLKMWRDYFPNATIHGLDIYKKEINEERINVYTGSQIDENYLIDLSNKVGGWDIIIDDGSHINKHVIKSFKILFPFLKEGGIYAIEDLQTSYWIEAGGISSRNLNYFSTMGFLKRLCDGLNYAEFDKKNYKPTYFDLNVLSITFYHNLAFIEKGNNQSESPTNSKRLKLGWRKRALNKLKRYLNN